MEKSNRRALAGVILIDIGSFILLNNLGYVDFRITDVIGFWQLLFIGLGIFQLVTGNKKGGMVLITIGVVFWVFDFYHLRFRDYWPIILIAVGFGFFLRSRANRSKTSEEGDIDIVAILGGSQKKINSKEFAGGKLSAMLGGVELDLRQSSLKQGQSTLDVMAVLGGAKIFLPDDWVVNFEGTNVMGGFSDKRAHKPTEYFGNVLTIKGLVIMGGVELNS